MQVVLLQDVKTLGKAGDVVKANDGYARNFLIPKKMAVEANAANLAKLKQQKAYEAKVAAEELAAAKALSESISGKTIQMKVKAGEGGKLFGAIASKELAQEIEKQLGVAVDKKKIVLPDPIKTLGVHPVSVKLHEDVTAAIKVDVAAE
ncbi:MAG: 50S ribosomal protein L9 [Oscillospiraceae bacterium]|nr:50S ribosomal protein L9 [Oscillospiraceae bacterium]